jgi:hypothetical protein
VILGRSFEEEKKCEPIPSTVLKWARHNKCAEVTLPPKVGPFFKLGIGL